MKLVYFAQPIYLYLTLRTIMCLSGQFVPEGIELIASPPNFAVYDIFTYRERIENCPDLSSLKRLILSQVLTSYVA